jgi:hypothetical protein
MFKPLWQYGRAICFADADLNGKLKETRSSLISFSAPTASPFS